MKPTASFVFLTLWASLASAVNVRAPAEIRTSETCGDPTNALPFYRSYKSTTVDHFYTTDVTLVNNAVAANYALQSVAGLVFVTQEESTAPFYRLHSVDATDNFYTMSTTERDNALQHGYVSVANDPETYIYPTQICGSIPLYRLYNSVGKDNFYTTSESERLDFISNQGYTDIEIAGYVLPIATNECV
ncbi:hypothetical protein FB451DRAFT_1295130 [Mycena latifolia]|nr:hypothetical protein FB451DRAFT_1295130 [Mycena latifolia]